METQLIREFIVLSETLSFSEASEKLFISQSSLSKHIKALEEALGVQLFYRDRSHVQLTKFGEAIMRSAKSLLNSELALREAVAFAARDNLLCIGVSPSNSNDDFFHALLKLNFNLDDGKVKLRIIVDDTRALLNNLHAGICDFALVNYSNPNTMSGEFTKLHYKDKSLMVALRVGHPLASQDRIEMRSLVNENFLLLQPDSFTTNLVVNECHKAGFAPKSVFYSNSGGYNKRLVSEGRGITFVTETGSGEFERRIIYKKLDPPVTISMMMCFLENRIITEKDRIFFHFAKDFIPDITKV